MKKRFARLHPSSWTSLLLSLVLTTGWVAGGLHAHPLQFVVEQTTLLASVRLPVEMCSICKLSDQPAVDPSIDSSVSATVPEIGNQDKPSWRETVPHLRHQSSRAPPAA